MLKKLLISLSMLAFPLTAQAADLAVKAPVAAPVMMADWSGLYAGAFGSWVSNKGGSTETYRDYDGDCDECANLQRVLSITAGNQNYKSGGLGFGGTLGYNYEIQKRFVIGIEGDLSYLTVKGASTAFNIGACFDGCYDTTASVTNQSQINWMGTIRARAGFEVLPSTLIFATGGLAFGQVEALSNIHGTTTLGDNANNPFGNIATVSQVRTGWAAGGGIEQKFGPKWSVKAEYLYYDLGSMSLNNTVTGINAWACCGVSGLITKTDSYRFKGDWARIGLNYALD